MNKLYTNAVGEKYSAKSFLYYTVSVHDEDVARCESCGGGCSVLLRREHQFCKISPVICCFYIEYQHFYDLFSKKWSSRAIFGHKIWLLGGKEIQNALIFGYFVYFVLF